MRLVREAILPAWDTDGFRTRVLGPMAPAHIRTASGVKRQGKDFGLEDDAWTDVWSSCEMVPWTDGGAAHVGDRHDGDLGGGGDAAGLRRAG